MGIKGVKKRNTYMLADKCLTLSFVLRKVWFTELCAICKRRVSSLPRNSQAVVWDFAENAERGVRLF